MFDYLPALSLAALLPVIVTVALYLIDKRTPFKRLPHWPKQIVFGLIFGCVAIWETENGISILGVTMNVRDAAPICAGLIFGAPAGIISGLIGGVERYLAAAWGAGEYTKIACSVATMFAGFFTAWLRKFMFEDKRPSWHYGLAAGIITEVIHMMTVFLTHMNDTQRAFAIVEKCTIPMSLLTGFSAMLSLLLLALISRERLRLPKAKTKLSQTFQRDLMICMLIAFFVTGLFSFSFQNTAATRQAENLLRLNIKDVRTDISDASDENLLNITRSVADYLDKTEQPTSELLVQIGREYDIAEINIIDPNGIITASTYPDFINFDMNSGKQSAAFLVLLNGYVQEFVQEYQPTTSNPRLMRKYAGVVLKQGGFVQVAYDAEHFQREIAAQVVNVTRNRHIGENGFLVICNKNYEVISRSKEGRGAISFLSTPSSEDKPEEDTLFELEIQGKVHCCMYTTTEGYYIVGAVPKEDVLTTRNLPVYITVFMEVLLFAALFLLVYFLIKRRVVDNLQQINRSLGRITNGDLDTTVDVRTNLEFVSLSDDINQTVTTLKKYISEAEARIDKELEFAKTIQSSALPRVFPPFPGRQEFEIWAGMKTAKEVGGDFYDFYLLGEHKLAFLIADVSGKGIPAAMFMMTAKTLIKSFAETGAEVNDVFTHANNELCKNNDAGMFVTAWMGILDLNTGLLTFANAGHNPPLLRKKDGSFAYLKSRPGLVLAGMEGIPYQSHELALEPGDTLFLYTDGVTEATDAQNRLYGEQRLMDCLNRLPDNNTELLCKEVKADVDRFVAEAPQFDDITMLCLNFKKKTEESL